MGKRCILICSGLILAVIFGFFLISRSSYEFIKLFVWPPKISFYSAENIKNSAINANYLISGDVFWGRAIDLYAQQTSLKYDWPFSRLNDFDRSKYDGWIADMECPVTDKKVPYQVQVDSLIFSCSPDYLGAAKDWFNVFTLANNHTDNTGADGFTDTRNNLSSAGLQFFGHYDISQKEDLCEVVSLNVNVDKQKKKLPIAMCGYHWLARQPTDEELAEISKYGAYFPVWVFPHGGEEYAIHSNAQQQTLYRKMIDLGADAIFSDHPHVVQETEAYKGKLIVYDLGNLIFDQWFDVEVTKSLIVNVQISVENSDQLKPYLDLATSCATFKDNCLKEAEQKKLKGYKLDYSYDIICGERSAASLNDKLTHKCSQSNYDWLVERTNWQVTSAGLTH
ncbi:hypothetical protein A3F05_03230 [Candidatus Saccharibacteria bacterium RIFCSPHIGHO2_12_FULL_47_17]|nr:MAG: hypothetical protein A3F05_03230 [Candidatus Saccharibacteria bacterium RIFCSPHIGHO2_12_FULL_47_17]